MRAWLILIFCFLFAVRAQGANKDLSLSDITQRSKITLEVTIVSVANIKKTKKAYGKYETYVDEYRFKVKVNEVLQGDASFKGKTIWLARAAWAIPGKDMEPEHDFYRSGYSLEKAKKKDTLIVFLVSDGVSKSNDNHKWSYLLWQYEASKKKEEIQELLKSPPSTQPAEEK
jgi:hypothetical protein